MRLLSRLVVLSLALMLVFSHEAGAQRTRATRKKPFAEFSASAQRLKDSIAVHVAAPLQASDAPLLTAATPYDEVVLRDSLLAVARSQLGTRYRLGAQAPGKAFDCSGLVKFVLGALSFTLPRTAHEQAKFGQEVARDTAHLRPGDLLTFGTRRHITHIGIYAGDGMVIHASTTKRRVIETSLASLGPSLLRKWQSARRLITLADSTGEAQ